MATANNPEIEKILFIIMDKPKDRDAYFLISLTDYCFTFPMEPLPGAGAAGVVATSPVM